MDVGTATYRPIGITHDVGAPCDPDALAFITAHETSTGLSMDTIQKNAICGFVERLKGIGTVNSSDLWTGLVANGARLYPLCPTNNTTANEAGYKMDLIGAAAAGTYNNFLPVDIAPTGVTGGATKYFEMDVAPNNYSQNTGSGFYYSRNVPTVNGYGIGVNAGSNKRWQIRTLTAADGRIIVMYNNNSAEIDNTPSTLIGLIGSNKPSKLLQDITINASTSVSGLPTTTVSRGLLNFYAHAQNDIGTANGFSDSELSMYMVGGQYLDALELADFNEAVQWYQANVITGGREIPYVDANALSFINAHEIATGSPMGAIQQSAVIGFVERLKGIGTVNNTNIWTSMVANGSTLFPLCPIDDSTANASAYNMELISASTVGTYTNFLPGDFTPQGVIGGSTKSFDTGIASNAYPVDNFGYGFYSRSNTASNSHIDVGSTSDGFAQVRTAAGQFGGRVNNAVDPGPVASPNSLGLFQMQAGAPNLIDKVKNGVAVLSSTQTHSTNTVPYTFHKYVSSYSPRQLSMYILGMPYLSANGLADFYEAVQWYQTNIITTGRNV